jgi:hypothetical protein
MGVPAELQRTYREGRLVPFIGAGVSMGISWEGPAGLKRGPSWEQLVAAAAKDLGFHSLELARAHGTDLHILEYFRQKKGSVAPLTNWLQRELDPKEDVLKQAPVLKQLAAMAASKLYYTTNFDFFLENGLRLNGRTVHVVRGEAEMGMRGSDCEVVKFHGDFDCPDNIVLSESDYERRLTLSTYLDHRLLSDLAGRTLLFIGYSFRDANVSYLFRLFRDRMDRMPHPPSRARAYIVTSNPSDFEHSLFKSRQIEVIPIKGIDHNEEIVQVLKDIAAKE